MLLKFLEVLKNKSVNRISVSFFAHHNILYMPREVVHFLSLKWLCQQFKFHVKSLIFTLSLGGGASPVPSRPFFHRSLPFICPWPATGGVQLIVQCGNLNTFTLPDESGQILSEQILGLDWAIHQPAPIALSAILTALNAEHDRYSGRCTEALKQYTHTGPKLCQYSLNVYMYCISVTLGIREVHHFGIYRT